LALAEQIWFAMLHFFPMTLAVVAVWVCVVLISMATDHGGVRLFLFGCMPPFAIPLVILLCGVVFAHDPPWVTGVKAPAYQLYIIDTLLLSHLPLAALLIWRWRYWWPAVISSAILAGYVSLFATLISYSSVSGIWP
jgi:hypothetical protein